MSESERMKDNGVIFIHKRNKHYISVLSVQYFFCHNFFFIIVKPRMSVCPNDYIIGLNALDSVPVSIKSHFIWSFLFLFYLIKFCLIYVYYYEFVKNGSKENNNDNKSTCNG